MDAFYSQKYKHEVNALDYTEVIAVTVSETFTIFLKLHGKKKLDSFYTSITKDTQGLILCHN